MFRTNSIIINIKTDKILNNKCKKTPNWGVFLIEIADFTPIDDGVKLCYKSVSFTDALFLLKKVCFFKKLLLNG